MIYFKNEDGEVFAYETQSDRDIYGADDLVKMTLEEADSYLNPPVAVIVPDKVTMRQARLALHAAGLLAGVESALDALPEPLRASARIEWDYSSEVYRNKDLVVMLAGALELADEQIDDLFITAATL